MGFSVMCGISALEFFSIFIIRFFAKREEIRDRAEEGSQVSETQPGANFKPGEV